MSVLLGSKFETYHDMGDAAKQRNLKSQGIDLICSDFEDLSALASTIFECVNQRVYLP